MTGSPTNTVGHGPFFLKFHFSKWLFSDSFKKHAYRIICYSTLFTRTHAKPNIFPNKLLPVTYRLDGCPYLLSPFQMQRYIFNLEASSLSMTQFITAKYTASLTSTIHQLLTEIGHVLPSASSSHMLELKIACS